MGMWTDDDEQEKTADMLKLRLDNFIGKKVDRAVEKQLITAEDGKKLNKGITKAIKKQKDLDWWDDQEGKKSFEILTDLLEDLIDNDQDFEDELELLNKIEKA